MVQALSMRRQKRHAAHQGCGAADQERRRGRPRQLPVSAGRTARYSVRDFYGMASSNLAWHYHSCSMLRLHVHQQQDAKSCRSC